MVSRYLVYPSLFPAEIESLVFRSRKADPGCCKHTTGDGVLHGSGLRYVFGGTFKVEIYSLASTGLLYANSFCGLRIWRSGRRFGRGKESAIPARKKESFYC